MNYLNKYSGTAAANLYYQGDGKWSLHVMEDNRYRRLINDDKSIDAIDLEGMAGMIQVGEMMPGYNRKIVSITKCNERLPTGRNEYEIKCFGW